MWRLHVDKGWLPHIECHHLLRQSLPVEPTLVNRTYLLGLPILASAGLCFVARPGLTRLVLLLPL